MPIVMRRLKIAGTELAYCLNDPGPNYGHKSPVSIVIEVDAGTCSAEWWHIADRLGKKFPVLAYDRSGYGTSGRARKPRTPAVVCSELSQLLDGIGWKNNIVFLGHGIGGLYSQYFSRMYPERVRGMVLLDPMTAFNYRFRWELTIREFRGSGIDRAGSLTGGAIACSLGLGFFLKGLLEQAPPFYYHPDYSEEAKKYLLKSLIRGRHYRTALSEYRYAQEDREVDILRSGKGPVAVPIALVTHASAPMVDEIMYFGSLERNAAEKVEALWQDIMMSCVDQSAHGKRFQTKRAGHYIHLSDWDLVSKALDYVLSAS